jgi:predicted Rossmann fold flavoprotein
LALFFIPQVKPLAYTYGMNVAIIGASSAGLYTAIFLKKAHPDYRVEVFDKNEKIGRKLAATGNGRCNLLNLSTGPEDFNYPLYMEPLLKEYPYAVLKKALGSLGVQLVSDGVYVYPATMNANSYVKYLSDLANSLGIVFHLKTKVLDYEGGAPWTLLCGNETFKADALVFAPGGMSSPNLGSDGSLFTTFFRHGYNIIPLKPSLCPIATKEKTKSLLGLRHAAKVTVTADGRLVHEEEGEVLFKEDGLSGIVIFNCESFICRLIGTPEVSLWLDLFPAIHLADLTESLVSSAALNPTFFLDAYLQAPLRDYVLKAAGVSLSKALSKSDLFKIAKAMKGLEFHFDHAYDFASSQVTAGGVDLNDIDEMMKSKLEKNVSFVGEALDVDGLCGGYNLTWCLISSLLAVKGL